MKPFVRVAGVRPRPPESIQRYQAPRNPYGFLDLKGKEALAFHELVIDINEWFLSGATGRTKEIMDLAYECLVKPNLPCAVELPGGRVIPYRTSDGVSGIVISESNLTGQWINTSDLPQGT